RRRRHTISKRDWSPDVCSSDLLLVVLLLNRDREFGLTQFARIAFDSVGLLRRLDAFGVLFGMGVLSQHVLHVLLGQRRSALRRRGHHIVHSFTSDTLDVDTAVFGVQVLYDGCSRVLNSIVTLVW